MGVIHEIFVFLCFTQCIAVVDAYAKMAFQFIAAWMVSGFSSPTTPVLITLLAEITFVLFVCFTLIIVLS